MMFRVEDHPHNAPSTWSARKDGRTWSLVTKDGVVLQSGIRTKTATEAYKVAGFHVNLYEKEGRWYAGQPIAGWKPYKPAPDRDIYQDGPLFRVLEETSLMAWVTLATYATEDEARAFIDGLALTSSARSNPARHELAVRTHQAALAKLRASA